MSAAAPPWYVGIRTVEPPSTLHLYAQPADPAFLDAHQAFAAQHPWFHVERLDAASHFPAFEVPDTIAEHLRRFIAL